MRYQVLGNTGLKVSALGFGAASLGGEYGSVDLAEGERAVRCAIDHGINYFDVAPYYGGTLAESRLGEALVGRRNSVILATKVGRYKVPGGEEFDFSAARICISLEQSLRRLKTDYVDVYQAHDIEFVPRKQIIEETLPAMEQLKKEGKVRYVGITAYPLYLLKDVAQKAPVDTILTYCRYNLMDTSLDVVLTPITRFHGIGLINASPLHMGVLTEKGAPSWHPLPKHALQTASRASEYCRRKGANISEIAIQFAVAHEHVGTTVVGMKTERHAMRNIVALDIPLDQELLFEVQEILKPVVNICWQEGIPENFDPGATPQQSE